MNEHSDIIEFKLVQQIHDEISWKMHEVDNEYLAKVFMSFSVSDYAKMPVEEVMIAFDLNQLSFIHDKDFIQHMHCCALQQIVSELNRDLIRKETYEWCISRVSAMKDKLMSGV